MWRKNDQNVAEHEIVRDREVVLGEWELPKINISRRTRKRKQGEEKHG